MGVCHYDLEDGSFMLVVNGEEQWKKLDEFLERYKPRTTSEFSEMLERMKEQGEAEQK